MVPVLPGNYQPISVKHILIGVVLPEKAVGEHHLPYVSLHMGPRADHLGAFDNGLFTGCRLEYDPCHIAGAAPGRFDPFPVDSLVDNHTVAWPSYLCRSGNGLERRLLGAGSLVVSLGMHMILFHLGSSF